MTVKKRRTCGKHGYTDQGDYRQNGASVEDGVSVGRNAAPLNHKGAADESSGNKPESDLSVNRVVSH